MSCLFQLPEAGACQAPFLHLQSQLSVFRCLSAEFVTLPFFFCSQVSQVSFCLPLTRTRDFI